MGPHVDRYSTMYIKAALLSRRGRLLPLYLAFAITINLIWFCCGELLGNKSNTTFNLSSISNMLQRVTRGKRDMVELGSNGEGDEGRASKGDKGG